MDYTKSIPDIYSDCLTPNSKKIIMEVQKIYLTDNDYGYISLIHITSKNLSNFTFVLIKSNIGCDIDAYPNFNNSIYFLNTKQKVIRYVPIKCDELYDNAYIKIHKISIINTKYKIHKFDDDYCTGDEDMMIFKKDIKNYVCTFTIRIKLYDPISERTYKIDKKKLKIIKLKSQNFIFSYEPILENNRLIVLYLIGITNIENDETIKMDIKFTDINTIYYKYEKAIDDVKHFIFERSDKELEDYEIKIKYIEKHIKGVYYPNVIYTKIDKN
jgi:hypothetical protein